MQWNRLPKSIFQPRFYEGMMTGSDPEPYYVNCHYTLYDAATEQPRCTEWGRSVDLSTYYFQNCTPPCYDPHTPTYTYVALNHYFGRSVEEYLQKSTRGVRYTEGGWGLKKYFDWEYECFLAGLKFDLASYAHAHVVENKLVALGFLKSSAPPDFEIPPPSWEDCELDRLGCIIQSAVSQRLDFDDEFYVNQYTDAARFVLDGIVPYPLMHYAWVGYLQKKDARWITDARLKSPFRANAFITPYRH